MDAVSMLLWAVAIVAAAFVAYNLLHYVLFLLATHPKDAGGIGHVLNEFEQRQLVEWVPKADDFLKHDDEHRTYDDVFGPYRGEHDNYSTCVFPRATFTHRLRVGLISARSRRTGCACWTWDADRVPPPTISPAGARSKSPA